MNEERPMKMLLLVSVGAVLLACAGTYVATSRWSSSTFAVGGSNGGSAEETLRALEGQVVQGVQDRAQAERVLTESRAAALIQGVEEAKAVTVKAQEAARRWGTEVPNLLTSEAGRKLASSPARVVAFQALTQRSGRPSDSSIAVLMQRLETLEAELQRIRSSGDAQLSTDVQAQFAAQLEQDRNSAESALASVQEDLESVTTLVSLASKDNVAETSLEAALAALKQEQAEKRAQLIAAELRQVSDKQNALDAEMEGRNATQIAEANRRKRNAELQAEEARILADAELVTKKAKADELRNRANSAAVQAMYAPVLAKGRTQPNGHTGNGDVGWGRDHSTVPRPASMSAIQSAGAMSSFDRFVKMMTLEKNDRIAWPKMDDEAKQAEYMRRYSEFKELAPIWLELNLLEK